MKFFSSFFLSCLINIGIVFFLVAMGRGEKIKVYKVYKINLVKIPEEKRVIAQKPKLNIPKPKEEIKPTQEEQKFTSLPIEEEKEEVKGEAIPFIKEVKQEEAHIVIPVSSEESKEKEIFEATSLDAPLSIISYIPPKYPTRAKKQEIEGIVKIRLLINPEGGVENVEIIEENPKGFGFKDEVLKVVKHYKFSQPLVLKKPVFVYYVLPLRFSLED